MNKWIITITVMLPTLIEILDINVVNVCLDHIRGSLSAGIDEATWSITMYLVSNAIIIPISGWLSRLFGRKFYLILSIGVFTLSSLLCGLSWSIQSLILFRVFQGIGGGALQPISQAILFETFPPRQHGMAMAIFGIGAMFGPIAGPILGGWITDNWSWHWIFFINIPIGILSIIMAILFIHNPPYMEKLRLRMDYLGLIFIALGLGCLQIVLDQGQRKDWFSSDMITWLTVVSVISLGFLLIVESRIKEPVINLGLFRDLSFSTGNIVMFLAFFNIFAAIVLLPLYVQTLMGYTATLAGLLLGPGGFAAVLALVLAGRLVTKINPKALLIFGLLVASCATFVMSKFNLAADFASIMWPRLAVGFGFGFIFVSLTNLTLSHVKKEQMGNATAMFNLIRNLGGSFGVAFVTTVLARQAQVHQARLVDHLTPFDNVYRIGLQKIEAVLQLKGFEGAEAVKGSLGAVYRELTRQAAMLSFNDAFHILAILCLCTIPLVFLLKKPEHMRDRGPI